MFSEFPSRRDTFRLAARAVAAGSIGGSLVQTAMASAQPVGAKLAELEKRVGGRLGVCAIDTRFGGVIGHRMDERFAMCSTFKLSLAAAMLEQADKGKLSLDKPITYGKDDIVPNSPVTEDNLSKGSMTIKALSEATQKTSDNAAANLLLKQIGGPAGLTQFYRRHGDNVSRLDRYEPAMNEFKPGDQRDTTSPYAYAMLVENILTGSILSTASRELLIQWMIDTKTGLKRIRAGVPKEWRVGDKTGTGMPGKYNDVAICWPPRQPPLIVAIYYQSASPSMDMRDEDQKVLADAARLIVEWVS
jgi:beta-lactamase class A